MKSHLPAAVAASLRDLVTAVSRLVTSVAETATREASSAARSVAAKASVVRAAGKGDLLEDVAAKGAKLSRSIKAHWDTMSPKQRAARIKKMLAARGLKPKPKKKGPPSARSVKLKQSIKAHWDAMTPAERAARVRKMLAGRGLKPKAPRKAKRAE